MSQAFIDIRSAVSVFSLVLAAMGAADPARAEDEPLLTALKTIEQQESTINNLAFDVHLSNETFRYDGARWVVIDRAPDIQPYGGMISFDASIEFLLATSAYQVDLKRYGSGSQIHDSSVIHSYSETSFVCDGEEFLKYDRTAYTTSEPVPDLSAPPATWPGVHQFSGWAVIDTADHQGRHLENNEDYFPLYAGRHGLGWVTPFVAPLMEPPTRVAELFRKRLAEREKVIFAETAEGNWELTFGMPYGFKIFYSPKFERVVRAQWGGCDKCPDVEITPGNWNIQSDVQFEYDGDSRIPYAVSVIDDIYGLPGSFNQQERNGRRWTFTKTRLNPELKIEVSQVEFEKGTRIENHVTRMLTMEGADFEDAETAMRNYLLRNRLLDADDP